MKMKVSDSIIPSVLCNQNIKLENSKLWVSEDKARWGYWKQANVSSVYKKHYPESLLVSNKHAKDVKLQN